MRRNRPVGWVVALLIESVVSLPAMSGTTTWNGSGDGTSWFDGANWSGGLPVAGDDAIINSGVILLTNSTPELSSLVMGGGSLVFSNWTTKVTATNVSINAGSITLPSAFSTAQMSNRVWIVATNFTLATGASVNVNALGYMAQNGPGAAVPGLDSVGPGAGHGGNGQNTCRTVQIGGGIYGSASSPVAPGSGGGRAVVPPNGGGSGGGAVRIQGGTVTIDGTISANGQDGPTGYGGGGSGGSIFITCSVFGGNATGLLSANGGASNHGNINSGASGSGGGGRIAVTYSSLSGSSDVRLSVDAGTPKQNPFPTDIGTLYFSDSSFLSPGMSQILAGKVCGPGFGSWSIGSLAVTNGTIALGDGSFVLTVSNDLSVSGGAELAVGRTAGVGQSQAINVGGGVVLNGGTLTLGREGNQPESTLTVVGDMTLANGGSFFVHSGPTNGSAEYGSLVAVTGNVSIGQDCWVHVTSHPTNGGSAMFRMANLTIATNAGFNADSWFEGTATRYWYRRGYDSQTGPGAGTSAMGSGGGHGGAGGDTTGASGGQAYGVTNAPVQPGSGGGRHTPGYTTGSGGPGGGVIRIEARDVVLNGTLTASGSDAIAFSTGGGGGAGGSIYMFCRKFSGNSGGRIAAAGGDGAVGSGGDTPGGGGGGRVTVWCNFPEEERAVVLAGDMRRASVAGSHPDFHGAVSVTGGVANTGSGTDGETGSIVFLTYVPPRGTVVTIR